MRIIFELTAEAIPDSGEIIWFTGNLFVREHVKILLGLEAKRSERDLGILNNSYTVISACTFLKFVNSYMLIFTQLARTHLCSSKYKFRFYHH